jgi:hypothetical protein
MAKLENNSLKYGVNSANNANNAFSNAYNQEMDTQRNMQVQTTMRQKTLLEAMKGEQEEKLAFQKQFFGYDPRTGQAAKDINDPALQKQYVDEVNKNMKAGLMPNTRLRAEIYDSMPRELYVDRQGELGTRYTPYGFSRITPAALVSQEAADKASSLNTDPVNMFRLYEPGMKLPSMGE